jgi:outer membrane protein assembly factor BamD (BamD/ComL family)
MRSIRRLVLIAAFSAATVLLAFSSDPALADKRVALVIGNSAYQKVARLPNPANDASAMAQLFKNAGFDFVDLQLDLGIQDFKRAIRRFEDAASDADMAVVFFAGHGLELRGTNYMIPVDARLADYRDAPDETIPLDRIVEAVEGAKRLRLVIVDACRDNPFVVTMKQLASLRTVSRGLARIEPQSTDMLIAYAARAGSTADDGHGDHSPFTTALLHNLTVPGLDIRLAFGRVRDDVMKITGNRQEPFVYGSLGGGEVPLVVPLVPPPSQPKEPLAVDVKGDYERVREIGTKQAWEVFLDTYKTGFYPSLAAEQVKKLIAAEQGPKVAMLEPSAPPSPAPPRSDEQRAWDRIRDTGDQAAVQEFIKLYPRSPLVLNAKKRLETLQQIAREDKARADREAQQHAEEERRAKAAEAERQKAEKAAEVERLKAEQAKAAAAERQKAEQAKAAEAERRRAEEQAKAAEAERLKAEKVAEAERQKAEKAAEAERQKAEQAKAAEAERQKATQTAPTEPTDDHVTPGPNPNNVAAPASPPAPSATEARAWDQIKDSDKQAVLQDFIKRYPKSSLVPDAQKRLETLQQIAQEREEKARADREAAQQRAEEERQARAWDQIKDSDKPAALQDFIKRYPKSPFLLNAQKRLETLQQIAQEREQKARADREAAQQRAEEERRAKAAEAERLKAEKAADAERQKAEQQAVLEAKAAEADRQKAEKPAVPVVESNTSELIKAAQVELIRLGCFSGKPDGTLNDATKTGINHYLSRRGSPDTDAVVTESFVSDLRNQQLKNCQLDCPSGQRADGDFCVASKKSPQSSKSARQHDDVQDKPKASRQPARQETRQADRKPERPERPSAAPQPQVHQEVSSTPRGSGPMIGVGF